MIDLLRRFWAWARELGFRRIAGTVLVVAALLWLLGSLVIEDLQVCSTTEGPRGTKSSCGPVSVFYFSCLLVPGLLLLGWSVEEIAIPGVGTFRPPWSRRSHHAGDDAPSPRDRFRESWAELNPWSRLASRLLSDSFHAALAAATTTPGDVSGSSLTQGDADLIKSLEPGASFTAAAAADWANDKRETLNSLRSLADPGQAFADEEFDDGAARVDELLADLRDRRLLR